MEFNATAPRAALQGSTAAKITATQTAFEVASDALQIFGGNGISKEYPMEKLLRLFNRYQAKFGMKILSR